MVASCTVDRHLLYPGIPNVRHRKHSSPACSRNSRIPVFPVICHVKLCLIFYYVNICDALSYPVVELRSAQGKSPCFVCRRERDSNFGDVLFHRKRIHTSLTRQKQMNSVNDEPFQSHTQTVVFGNILPVSILLNWQKCWPTIKVASGIPQV